MKLPLVFCLTAVLVSAAEVPMVKVSSTAEPMEKGKFEPTWESLQQYEPPEWFRDAKFGIWAHWGPQCQPEHGDWYARFMYMENVPDWAPRDYEFHRKTYGPQSKFGFKDVINTWKAEKWNPNSLMALYKRAGAQYFFALANHHDNFDLWDSKYQPWNSTRVGPKKDLIAGWAKAARAQGMKFGVSVHAAHAWTWYEPAQGADAAGEFAGVPYDGKLAKADGKNQWWDGLDPQDLYAQNHPRSVKSEDPNMLGQQWEWGNGASQPDAAYCEKFYNRTLDLINRYQPDLVYFDDTVLPLWPVSDVGLQIAAHFYNRNMREHGGKLEAVMFGKILDEQQRKAMVWDVERGQSNQIEPRPWQSDTCIGQWHYQRSLFTDHGYKNARTVIQTLVDVVSKNGNLLLSIPVRGDGSIDDDELKVVRDIADWMDINRECIFNTRPWKVCGEGPALENAAPITAQGFNEGKGKALTAEDIRYTRKGNVLYAIVLGQPKQPVHLKSLGTTAGLLDENITEIQLLGNTSKIRWSRTPQGLTVYPPENSGGDVATVFAISLK